MNAFANLQQIAEGQELHTSNQWHRMKQKKIRKGFIPEDVLEEVHSSENFIGINLCTDIRMIRDKLKRGKKQNEGKK